MKTICLAGIAVVTLGLLGCTSSMDGHTNVSLFTSPNPVGVSFHANRGAHP